MLGVSRLSGPDRPSITGRARLSAATILVAALLALVWTAGPAAAHADLDNATPSNGATVDSLDAVTLRFASPVLGDFSSVVLTTEDDRPVPLSAPVVVDNTMTATLDGPPPGPGLYIVSYRAVAVDGHPITGSLAFTLDQPASAAAETSARPTTNTTPLPTQAPAPAPTEDAAAATEGAGGGAGVLAVVAAVGVLAGIGLWASVRRRSRQ